MSFLISFFIVYWLRKQLNTPELQAKWSSWLSNGLLIIVGAFIFTKVTAKHFPSFVLGYAILYYIWDQLIQKHEEFKNGKPLFISLLPIAVIYLGTESIEFLHKSFYKKYDNYLDAVEFIGFIWFIVTYINYNRQIKALKAEQLARQIEALENKATQARKEQLEVLVQERTAELQAQNQKLSNTLKELSAAQQQLIHAEKMASLGELTAGIAHEIQNPLNFINNFSELNAELAQELKDAVKAADWEEATDIANSIVTNQQKITEHGKRADSIVKSMLQHSRGGSGQPEAVNINDLASECIKLSYHGMRAKDKTFNAAMDIQLDPHAGIIQCLPSELNRVLLNICTNAFYAVTQKKKDTAGSEYNPRVCLRTYAQAGAVKITIEDNGTGMPDSIREKIFQPFFTTKPTGEGTGLGLSMSYDIITKGHRGTIHVDSNLGEGTIFTIVLPAQ